MLEVGIEAEIEQSKSDGCDPELLSSTEVTEDLNTSLARALGFFRDAADSFSKVRTLSLG